MNEKIVKIKPNKEPRADGLSIYPWNFLPLAPPQDCVFDSYRGTVGFDIFPFAITTRIASANEVYLKLYEDMGDTDEGQRP